MSKSRTQRVAAYGLIKESNRILLCRISSRLPKWQGYWTLPGGGIEFGESPVDAMIREVKEETGLRVEPIGLAGIDSITSETDDQVFHGIRIMFHAKQVSGTLANETDGSTDLCRWCSLDEVSGMRLVDLAESGIKLAQERQCNGL